MTTEYSAVARAVLLLTIFQSCIPLAGLRQRRRLVLPLTVHHLVEPADAHWIPL